MGKIIPALTPDQIQFIELQHIFFVGTAAPEGRVNISPKGMDSLRVLGPSQVVWLNLTGSGNETAAHLLQSPRMTIMFCAFEGKPKILRLYGKAKMYHQRDDSFDEYINLFPPILGARQIMVLDIDTVQTSCGFAVPVMEFKEERTVLKDWAEKKGEAGIQTYWENRNTQSLDGYETQILKDPKAKTE